MHLVRYRFRQILSLGLILGLVSEPSFAQISCVYMGGNGIRLSPRSGTQTFLQEQALNPTVPNFGNISAPAHAAEVQLLKAGPLRELTKKAPFILAALGIA